MQGASSTNVHDVSNRRRVGAMSPLRSEQGKRSGYLHMYTFSANSDCRHGKDVVVVIIFLHELSHRQRYRNFAIAKEADQCSEGRRRGRPIAADRSTSSTCFSGKEVIESTYSWFDEVLSCS